MVKRAVLIGVNYAGQPQPLKGCINDAHNLANFLVKNFGYSPENMLILTDDNNNNSSGDLPPFKKQEQHNNNNNNNEESEEEESEEEESEEEEEDKKKKNKKEKEKKVKKEKVKDKKDKGGKKEKKEKKGKGEKKNKKKAKKRELDDADILYLEASRGVEEISRAAPAFLRGPATRAKILEAAQWLVTGASEGDNLFFHFSGHGVQVPDKSGDEDDGMDEAICPTDYRRAGIILDDDLHRILVSPLPSGVRLTAILDCCHSGSGMDLPFFYQPRDNNAKKMNKKVKNKKKKKDDDEDEGERGGIVVMLSGCKDEQVSADVVIDNGATGAVSYSFMVTLQKHRCRISYEDLLSEMKEVIAANVKSIRQCPMLSSNRANFDFAANFVA